MTGFAGFDVLAYPGTPEMAWLKANTNFKWTGFYLAPAPSRPSSGWMTNRAPLAGQGWGFAPIYVGQQVTGSGSHHTSGPQGTIDGNDACHLMATAGFPAGSFVYLDLENGKPFTSRQQDYVANWVDAVEHNRFQAGVYCSHTFAAEVHKLRSTTRIWAFKVATTAPHPVPGPPYPDIHPSGCGYTGAYAWQLGQNCIIDHPMAPNRKLKVDLDTALSGDPSQ
ncbi:hypothetical protein GGR25_003390 [Kaistia hirudinis]|uniref:Rv2525c-like glycoside hydrolase-like domain-containing protein n=1 Tax=Kaistia hirudinis TaxID=1293440 RepID=A0A840ARQ0_9HYPH|nr:glycoside hydrolase domain-containing protein [Kaistia hirudinis]MBB3932332.1 hypothetical protein [Kaistia hirudinis]